MVSTAIAHRYGQRRCVGDSATAATTAQVNATVSTSAISGAYSIDSLNDESVISLVARIR